MITHLKSVLTSSAAVLTTLALATSLSAGPAAAHQSPVVPAPAHPTVLSPGIPITTEVVQVPMIDRYWCRFFFCRK